VEHNVSVFNKIDGGLDRGGKGDQDPSHDTDNFNVYGRYPNRIFDLLIHWSLYDSVGELLFRSAYTGNFRLLDPDIQAGAYATSTAPAAPAVTNSSATPAAPATTISAATPATTLTTTSAATVAAQAATNQSEAPATTVADHVFANDWANPAIALVRSRASSLLAGQVI
jgi:hypothetical protein